jgi:hypothetical protein
MNKQIMFFLFLLTSIFLLAACQLNEGKMTVTADEKWTEKAPIQNMTNSKNGIMLNVEKELYRTSENEITVTILNESDFELTHGEPFALEKNINGTWYSVPFKINVFKTGSYSLRPHE